MEWNTAGRSCDDFSPSAVLRRNPKRNSAVNFKSINWPSLTEISVQVNWQAGVCPTLACVSQTETVWTVPNHGSQFSICLFFFLLAFCTWGFCFENQGTLLLFLTGCSWDSWKVSEEMKNLVDSEDAHSVITSPVSFYFCSWKQGCGSVRRGSSILSRGWKMEKAADKKHLSENMFFVNLLVNVLKGEQMCVFMHVLSLATFLKISPHLLQRSMLEHSSTC